MDTLRRIQQYAMSDDIWENGTVVRYMARVMAFLLALSALYAFKEQLLGRETFDGRKIRVVKARAEERPKEQETDEADSKKDR